MSCGLLGCQRSVASSGPNPGGQQCKKPQGEPPSIHPSPTSQSPLLAIQNDNLSRSTFAGNNVGPRAFKRLWSSTQCVLGRSCKSATGSVQTCRLAFVPQTYQADSISNAASCQKHTCETLVYSVVRFSGLSRWTAAFIRAHMVLHFHGHSMQCQVGSEMRLAGSMHWFHCPIRQQKEPLVITEKLYTLWGLKDSQFKFAPCPI